MNAVPPAPDELEALLRLLDDETPEVRVQVAERIALCGGDLSEWLATQPRILSRREKSLLVKMLSATRRENLIRDWIIPTGGVAGLRDDWDTFESLLRSLSDFLHDGITLRQPLSDALDLLYEEASEDGVSSANELRAFLFSGGRLKGNQRGYNDPRNSDLAWCIEEGLSNPIGLCVIFMLVARRLQFETEGINFPGHFMCRIFEDGYPLIIDCYDQGRLHLQSTLLENPELTRDQRMILTQSAAVGNILLRMLHNLKHALKKENRDQDVAIVEELIGTL
jgi:Transglutaminase-like superfamily